jgi:orotidine-5'-phosphate decarboxylase
MTKTELWNSIQEKSSFLCVGLDTDIHRIPKHLLKTPDPIFEFNKYVIDSTIDFAIAYKPNLAFYEAEGSKGWESLQKTLEYIPNRTFTIADAKRGDIGNTAAKYAETFFKHLNFDAVTLAPYMGKDSVQPFLNYSGKWSIVLALTSNQSSIDFEEEELKTGKKLFETVIEKSSLWGNDKNMMYVVGATKSDDFKAIRKLIPDHFLLVPGVGAQGGDLVSVAKTGFNDECGILVNSSRGIIYASEEKDFHLAVRNKAQALQLQMNDCLQKYLP